VKNLIIYLIFCYARIGVENFSKNDGFTGEIC
jgi:hypothetical protein